MGWFLHIGVSICRRADTRGGARWTHLHFRAAVRPLIRPAWD